MCAESVCVSVSCINLIDYSDSASSLLAAFILPCLRDPSRLWRKNVCLIFVWVMSLSVHTSLMYVSVKSRCFRCLKRVLHVCERECLFAARPWL